MAEDTPNIQPAEGDSGVKDFKVLSLQTPDENVSLDEYTADQLRDALKEASKGPVNADNERRKQDIAYHLARKG